MPINLPTYEQQQQAITLLQELGVDIDTLLAGRVVKSVQRGVATNETAGVNQQATVSISAVNMEKSLLFASACMTTTQVPAVTVSAKLDSPTSLKLNYTIQTTATLDISWQVIEFY